MVRITILYPKVDNGFFDVEYYREVHSRLAIQRLRSGIVSLTIEIAKKVESFPPPRFVAAGHYLCHSFEEFLETYLPHAQELQQDVKNYTDIEPIIQVSEVIAIDGAN